MKLSFSKNQWGVILGGSGEIGWGVAKRFYNEGLNLILLHRDAGSIKSEFKEKCDKLRREGSQLVAFNEDATSPKTQEKIVDLLIRESGKVSLFVDCLARGNLKDSIGADALTESDWALTLKSMGYNLQLWVNQLHQSQLFHKSASVIGLTSEGSENLIPGYGAVGAAKLVLERSIKELAVKLSDSGVRSNIIQSGVVDSRSLRLIPNYETIVKKALSRNPSSRLTTPEDIVGVIYLLSTPEARWINGAHIHVDGGEHLAGNI